MKANVGTVDRSIRAVAGILLLACWPLGLLEGTIALVAAVAGAVLLLTAAIRWCPPYALFGIDTGARKE